MFVAFLFVCMFVCLYVCLFAHVRAPRAHETCAQNIARMSRVKLHSLHKNPLNDPILAHAPLLDISTMEDAEAEALASICECRLGNL